MQIHVVQQGETLNSIARAYNTTASAIINANEINEPFTLTVGEALVIPIVGRFYVVQKGDTLYQIAQRFGLSYEALARINNISPNQVLNINQRLYIPPLPKPSIETNAYVEPLGEKVSENLVSSTKQAAPYLTYLAPFSFQILRDGSLKRPLLNDFPQIAQNNNVVLMMVVTNLEEGQFNGELGRIILTNEELQDVLLENIVEVAKELNFRDIHFDMEFLPVETKDNYIRFLEKAKARLKAENFLMSVALAPKTSGEQTGQWYEAHDYERIGAIADFVVLMTYEWGYSGGPPRAVSPIDEVRKVVDYAITTMPSNKIMLGQNLYGYNWTLPYVPGGEYAAAISPKTATQLAREKQVPIQFDETSQAPFIEYIDEENREHIIWFEDARSIQAKFDLIKEYGLRGISYWKLGLAFPQNWLLLEDNFNIVKR
ncbi:MAG TPA: glycoside hydrolase family 18 protein [Haloplasmataceae bacterium]